MAKNGVFTAKEARFIEEMERDYNGTKAAVRAGFSERTAGSAASRLLKNVDIQAAIAVRKAALSERIGITVEEIVGDYVDLKDADPNELTEVRRVCCRYCWGAGHLYQETPSERSARQAAHDHMLRVTPQKDWARIPEFDGLGGVGYDRRREIHPDCPECWGEGEEWILIKDTRKLTKRGRALYAGVKVTSQGVEVKMHDRGKALENLGRHLAMFTDKHVSLNLNLNADLPADPVEASLAYKRMMGG